MRELVVREGVVRAAFDAQRGSRLAIFATISDEAAGDEAVAGVLQQEARAVAGAA